MRRLARVARRQVARFHRDTERVAHDRDGESGDGGVRRRIGQRGPVGVRGALEAVADLALSTGGEATDDAQLRAHRREAGCVAVDEQAVTFVGGERHQIVDRVVKDGSGQLEAVEERLLAHQLHLADRLGRQVMRRLLGDAIGVMELVRIRGAKCFAVDELEGGVVEGVEDGRDAGAETAVSRYLRVEAQARVEQEPRCDAVLVLGEEPPVDGLAAIVEGERLALVTVVLAEAEVGAVLDAHHEPVRVQHDLAELKLGAQPLGIGVVLPQRRVARVLFGAGVEIASVVAEPVVDEAELGREAGDLHGAVREVEPRVLVAGAVAVGGEDGLEG